MDREGIQKKLTRVRPPQMQISYDLQAGDAIERKDLPFAVAALDDFTGQPAQPLAPFKNRCFVDVNSDNFESVLASIHPPLEFTLETDAGEKKLSGDANSGDLK